MAKHKVEISGINTSNIKVLTNEEMHELFIKLLLKDAIIYLMIDIFISLVP